MRNKSNDNHIPFIHNYCDRWCERCAFVNRCAVGSSPRLAEYELDADLQRELAEIDEENGKETAAAELEQKEQNSLVNFLTDTFAETKNMLKEIAESEGMDWDELVADAKNMEIEEPVWTPEMLELKAWSETYYMEVKKWFDEQFAQLNEKEVIAALLIQKNEPTVLVEKIYDAVQVIRWFQFMINIKIQRACSSKLSFDPEWEDPVQNDFNGTAKLTKIAVTRSIQAWETLSSFFVEKEDDLLSFLALLQKINKRMELIFPDANQFIRPGFDDTNS